MRKKLVAILQASMSSSRLPGKVLMPILGKPVLWYFWQRLERVAMIDEIIIATSYAQKDDPIEKFCGGHDIHCFRGSPTDVLDRFYKAALEARASHLIRISCDCPLVDPGLTVKLITYYYENGLQYCSIATGPSIKYDGYHGQYPLGLDAEIFSFSALELAWKESCGNLYREHVTPYLWQYPERFRVGLIMSQGKDYGELRWTMDDHEDYEVVRNIYETLYPENPCFGLTDILSLMEKQSEILMGRNQTLDGRGWHEKAIPHE